MRRLAVLSLIAALLLIVPSYAAAQFAYGPGGAIVVSTSETSASTQVNTAQSLLPAAMLTPPTSLCTSTQCTWTAQGILGTAVSAPGTMTIIMSYGAISLTVVSAETPTVNLQNVPWEATFWVAVDTTAGANGRALFGRFTWRDSNVVTTAPLIRTATTTGTITPTATQTVAMTATFSDVSIATGMITRRAWFGAGS
jgi:hypothetical protein